MLELVLTIFTWRKGWGPIALLPLAIALPLGLLFTAISNSIVPSVIADVVIYASLITMLAVGRNKPAATATPAPAQDVSRPTAA